MAVFFTADTHFGSQRALEHSKRPFVSVEVMDNILIDNWNSLITNEDYVYHLGDFGNYEVAKQLHGKIILIPGNHERANPNFISYHDYFEDVTTDMSSVFYKGCTINMAHEPSKLKNKMINNSRINLFGHLHKLCMIKVYGINVGIDCHNYKPIDFDTVLFYHNQLLSYYDDEVFF